LKKEDEQRLPIMPKFFNIMLAVVAALGYGNLSKKYADFWLL
jgi:hypothetical protein